MKTNAARHAPALLALPAIAAIAAAFTAGCLSPVDEAGRLRHREFQVEVSALDWLDIAYHPEEESGLAAHPVRIAVSGTGEVECHTGRSPRVWDPFSAKTEDPYWNEIISDRRHLTAAEIRDVLQRYIEEGALSRHSNKTPPDPPYIMLAGNISGEKIRLRTDNKHLVSLTEEILSNFPALLLRTP